MAGGIGVYAPLGDSLAVLSNNGTIYGGRAGGFPAFGAGGAGVNVTITDVLSNTGLIYGGAGSNGGAGVIIFGGRLSDSGLIKGGYVLTNPGLSIIGHYGGTGIEAAGSTLAVSGSVVGGLGDSATGGVGIFLDDSVLNLTGKVAGGSAAGNQLSSYKGGTGVYLEASSRVVIGAKGVVSGGYGGAGYVNGGPFNDGGAGLQAYASSDVIVNAGLVEGGAAN
jgi:hypothetical protein